MKKEKKQSIATVSISVLAIAALILITSPTLENKLANMLVLLLAMINVTIPICFHIYSKYKTNSKNILKDKNIDIAIIDIFQTSALIAACVGLVLILYSIANKVAYPISILELIAYFGITTVVLLANYFGTNSKSIKEKLHNFTLSVREFVLNNFTLNLLLVLLVIYFTKNTSYTVGIMAAYMFYAIERINHYYQEKTKDLPKANWLSTACLISINMEIAFLVNECSLIHNSVEKGLNTLPNIDFAYIGNLYLILIVTLIGSYLIKAEKEKGKK